MKEKDWPYPNSFDLTESNGNTPPNQTNVSEIEHETSNPLPVETEIQETDKYYCEIEEIRRRVPSFLEQEMKYKKERKNRITQLLGRTVVGAITLASLSYLAHESYELISENETTPEDTSQDNRKENKTGHYYDSQGNIHLVTLNN